MNKYKVNYHCSDKPGIICNEYNSGYSAYIGEDWKGAINDYTGEIVLTKYVNAETPYEAMRKFQKWQLNGLDEKFLD